MARSSIQRRLVTGTLGILFIVASSRPVLAQDRAATAKTAARAGGSASVSAAPTPPPDYRIAPNDVLSVVVWKEKDLTGDVVVRPDGKISIPLLNDVVAAGLTAEQLAQKIAAEARRFFKDPVPAVTVVLKEVNNNKAFIMGQVARPGPYVLSNDTTVLQLIAMAGGFAEFADTRHVLVMRGEGPDQRTWEFNYDDFVKRRNLAQNVVLKPGDTVIVP